jgi:hypothetical protein
MIEKDRSERLKGAGIERPTNAATRSRVWLCGEFKIREVVYILGYVTAAEGQRRLCATRP